MISLICDVNVKWINSFATQMRKSTSKAAPAKQSQCQCQSQSQSVSQASWPVTLGRVSLVHCAVVALIKMYRAVAMCEIVLATLIAAGQAQRGSARRCTHAHVECLINRGAARARGQPAKWRIGEKERKAIIIIRVRSRRRNAKSKTGYEKDEDG